MKRLSLNARMALETPVSEEIEVVLFEITHPQLDEPIRLSSDNAERISTDPLIYGTRSTWRGADPDRAPYLFIVADALLPSDSEDAPAEAQIILTPLDAELTEVLRSFSTPATLALAVVLASTPNLIEAEYLDLRLTLAEDSEGEVTLTFSREEIELEEYPSGRMTRYRFPGLHL